MYLEFPYKYSLLVSFSRLTDAVRISVEVLSVGVLLEGNRCI